MSYPGDQPRNPVTDTSELPAYVPPGQGSAEPGTPPPKQNRTRRNCLTGCLAAAVIAVIFAVIAGIMLKQAWNDFRDDDSATTTTSMAKSGKPADRTTYQAIVTKHVSTLGTEANAVGAACKDIREKAKCRGAIQVFRDELVATQSELNGVTPPAQFAKSDAQFRKALDDGLKGTDDVLAGMDGNPLKLGKGLITVAKAGSELQAAGAQLTEDANAAAG